MALLDKLYIQGIRSFSSDVQSMNFDSPFTLILGQNGCGKTTIIEALKYAITGSLPFGQGNNFVRDPKLDDVYESYGQVKLRFKSANQKDMVVVRSLQATQKVKKMEVKTLDVTLSVFENNISKQISSRCADMDEYLSNAFGVSKPILSYVIFCHQEEAYWPLDEGKKVKERFDEIFDSTKYNKCMTKILDLRKGILKEILEMKTAIEYLKENMDTASQKRRELEVKEKRYSDLQGQIESFEAEIEEVDTQYQQWREKFEKFAELDKKRDQLKHSLQTCIEQRENERKEITVLFEGSQHELEGTIETLDNQLVQKQSARKSAESKVQDYKKSESSLLQRISTVNEGIGRLESDLQHGHTLMKERNNKINQLAQVFGFSELDEVAEDNDFRELLLKIEDSFQIDRDKIDNMKQVNKREQHELQLKINRFLEAKTKLESKISAKKSNIAENGKQLEEISEMLQNADSRAKEKVVIEDKLQESRQALEEAVKSEDIQTLSRLIEKFKNECDDLEERQQTLQAEVKSLNDHRSVRSGLADLEKKISDLKTNIDKSRSKSDDAIKLLLSNATDSSIKTDLEGLLRSLKRDIDELSSQLTVKEREVSLLDLQRKQLKAEIQQKEAELLKNEEAAYELFGRRPYEEVLKSLDEELEKMQGQKGVFSSSQYLFDGYISKLRQKPCCPLCHRDFQKEKDVDDLVLELREKMTTLPDRVNEISTKLNSLQQRQRQLLQFKPVQEKSSHLRASEIPLLKQKLESVEEKLDAARHEVAIIQASLIDPQEKRVHAESMQSNVNDIDHYHKELISCVSERDKLKAKLPPGGPSRSFEEAYSEQEEVQKLCKQKRLEKEAAEERRRVYNNRINELREKVNGFTSQLLEIEKTLQGLGQLRERQAELSSLRPVLQAELEELLQRLRPAEEDRQGAERELRAAVLEHERKVRAEEKKLNEKEQERVILTKVQNDIKKHEAKQVPVKLQEARATCEKLSNEHRTLVQRRDETEQKLKQLSADIDGFESRKSQLKRNLLFMIYERKVSQIEEDLKYVEKDVGTIDVRGIERKLKELYGEKDRLISEKSTASGAQRELSDRIRSARKELEQAPLKNADQKYKEKLIHLTVKKHAEKDLQGYYKALEYAMQHFHRDRMSAINKIVRRLWRLIYKGNDIDHIEIKTDETTSATATSGSDKRRSYNYRVVQVKNGVELDMRGRCSAGQKVLACLIIRIALAEMFSANCGILTLDEPTTNLDKQNICSLTDAIAEIVQDHRDKRNFQLIVITHDHDFLQRMSHADFFSHYWEVSRSHRSNSLIVKKELNR